MSRRIPDDIVKRIKAWRRNAEWERTLREWLAGGEFRIDEVLRCQIMETANEEEQEKLNGIECPNPSGGERPC
jgi:hypothetical protein